MKKTKKIITAIIALFFTSGVFAPTAFASNTDGTIDPTYKYAWGENIGWLNFGTTEGNVHVNDSAMTGYVWSENLGWIPLNCANDNSCSTVNYKVSNNGNGTLSGYSWSADTGWVSFAPTNGGVTISASGELQGYAWGENIGWMVFNCSTTNSCATADYKVKTDWRPQNVRPACNNATDDDGNGRTDYPGDPGCSSLDDTTERDSGGSFIYSSSTSTTPTGTTTTQGTQTITLEEKPVILINNNTQKTTDRNVKLFLKGDSTTKTVWISENSSFPEGLKIPYSAPSIQVSFILSEDEGAKTIFAKFCNEKGQCSSAISDDIIFNREKPIVKLPPAEIEPVVEEPVVTVIEEPVVEPVIKPTIKPTIEQATTMEQAVEPIVEPATEPTEPIIPTEAPDTMKGEWELLQQKSMDELALAPLPQELTMFIGKFPDLQDTFNSIGVNKINDIKNLANVEFTLPGLTESIGLAKGIPISLLSAENKELLPTEIVFAKTGDGYIDFNSTLTITDKGEPRQKIASISGKPLELVIKTAKPMKSVTGYIVYKSRNSQNILSESTHRLIASLLSANLASSESIEERMVLQKFEYTDSDGDGIYIANINTPLVEGEYEIITVMDYKDPKLGTKEIKLITVIDPEGYIYEKNGSKETRIPDAVTSIYWLNPETKQYELWPAEKFQQENPQTTDVRGIYSFLVPEGSYYLKVEAPGYLTYEGKPFQLKNGSGIHSNIELTSKYWLLEIFDWKTVLLLLVIILLLYTFYKDNIRDRLRKKFSKNS